MKKVVITVPTLMAGGMERAAVNFGEILSKKGVEVKIFMISSDQVFYEVSENIELLYGKKDLNNKWQTFSSLLKLRKFIHDYKPDHVLSFSGKMSAYVSLSLYGIDVDVIPFHRGSPYKTYGRLNNYLNKKIFPKSKALVVQTETAKKVFTEKYNNKNIIVTPNPVRDIHINENIEKENIIITVSRLVKGKGLEKLINIFKNLENKQWNLYILGDGYLRNELQDQINKLGLKDRVKLLGFQKNVDDYFAKASIFAFSSESEGFPNALLEAMCAGLACISFDCPTGPSEMIVNGENGYLIPMDDDIEYEEKLNELIKNKELRASFGKEAIKLNKKHAPEKIVESFICDINKISHSA